MSKLTPEIKAQFSLEKQWQDYLQRVGITESQMHPVQLTETKRAFFGAFGQSLILTRDELTAYEDETAIDILRHLMNQVGDFWIKESGGAN